MLIFILTLTHECVSSKLPLRIYGGVDAKPEEFPYVVAIEIQNFYNFTNNTAIAYHRPHCTASALSPEWLLSAAHCLTIFKVGILQSSSLNSVVKMIVRYGHMEKSPWSKDSFSDVLYTIMHPFYVKNTSLQRLLRVQNDIGLLKVSPMNIRSYIKLSAVDYKTFYGHEAVTAGFGVTSKVNADGRVETNATLFLKKPLQVLKVLITKCLDRHILVPAICSAPKCYDVVSACSGDSGGPVIHQSGIIGILSLAQLNGYCGKPLPKARVDTVASITPVSPYIDWIYSNVNKILK